MLVIVTDRTGHVDLMLMHRRHPHQMLRISVLTTEFHCHRAQERAQRIEPQLGKIKDTVRIGSDIEAGIQLQILGRFAVLTDRDVIMCAGIAVHVVLQIAGTGDLVPAVRKARLKEHMTRAESLYKIVGNP